MLEPSIRFAFDPNNCNVKKQKLLERLGSEERVQLHLQSNKNTCNKVHTKIQGENEYIQHYNCLCNIVDRNVYSYLQMYNEYKKGTPMHANEGYLDSSCVLNELLYSIHTIVSTIESEEMEKQNKKQR